MDEFEDTQAFSPVNDTPIVASSESSTAGGMFDPVDDLDIPGFETKDETSGDDAEVAETKGEPAEEKPPVETKAEAKEKSEEKPTVVPAEQPRVVKAKNGDAEIDLREDAVIPWKVDGKVEQVPLRALLDNYAGKTSYDRKFQSLANDRKAFDSTQNRHKQLIVDLYEKTKAGKPFEAVQSMIEMTGVKLDARAYVKQLRESLIEQAKQLADMTPEQRELYENNEERDYLRSQLDKFNQQRADEEAAKALEARMATVAEKHGISYDEFAQTTEFLKQRVGQLGQNPSIVTPEYVVDYREDLRAHEVARDAIKEVDPSLIDERGIVTDEEKWAELAKLARENLKYISPAEFVALYKEAKQTKQAKAVAKKLDKTPVSTPAKAATKKPKAPTEQDFYSNFSADDRRW